MPESSGFELYDAEGTLRAKLGFGADGPVLALNDEAETPRIFAGFRRSTQEPLIATFDADLNLIWQSDEPSNSASQSATTASTGR